MSQKECDRVAPWKSPPYKAASAREPFCRRDLSWTDAADILPVL